MGHPLTTTRNSPRSSSPANAIRSRAGPASLSAGNHIHKTPMYGTNRRRHRPSPGHVARCNASRAGIIDPIAGHCCSADADAMPMATHCAGAGRLSGRRLWTRGSRTTAPACGPTIPTGLRSARTGRSTSRASAPLHDANPTANAGAERLFPRANESTRRPWSHRGTGSTATTPRRQSRSALGRTGKTNATLCTAHRHRPNGRSTHGNERIIHHPPCPASRELSRLLSLYAIRRHCGILRGNHRQRTLPIRSRSRTARSASNTTAQPPATGHDGGRLPAGSSAMDRPANPIQTNSRLCPLCANSPLGSISNNNRNPKHGRRPTLRRSQCAG